MMKNLVAAAGLLLTLAGCSPMGADTVTPPVRQSGAGKALPEAPPPPPLADDKKMCTADARLCVDGSYVSRNPDKGCAFNLCPGDSQQ